MILIKKLTVFSLAFALLCLAALGAALSFSSQAAVCRALFTVVLDAGHGGVDPGVTGKETGVKESDINLAIVRELEKCFSDAGFAVVLTRTDEGGLYGLATDGFKRRDMQERARIIAQAKPDLVLSVHQNNFIADHTRRGGQCFFRPSDANGRALAESIQSSLNALGGYDFSALAGDYYMLNCSPYPSAIVECGFLSNAEDEAMLCDAESRAQIARAIFAGTLAFLC